MALCAALGAATLLLSLFQWMQLIAARTGGNPFVGLDETNGPACAALWDSEVARTVQTLSGMPVAGWGVVFGLVAFTLPLSALVRRAGATDRPGNALWPAVCVTALSGLLVASLLTVASLLDAGLCATCLLTSALVFSYALIAFAEAPALELQPLFRGVSLASGAVGFAYLLLFIPGLRTPERDLPSGRFVMNIRPEDPESRAFRAMDNAERLAEAIEQIRGPRRPEFGSALKRYRDTEPLPLDAPRVLVGAWNAPVRITEFTDVKCIPCATIHTTLARIRTGAPLRSFAVERRHFPNDSACNKAIKGVSAGGVRCTAARAQICVEGQPDAAAFAAILHRYSRNLDDERIFALAEPLISREELAVCLASDETEARLQADIALAVAHGAEEPPLVLLNGRTVPAGSGPLLYTLILAEGDAYHPAFDGLFIEPAVEQKAEAPGAAPAGNAGAAH